MIQRYIDALLKFRDKKLALPHRVIFFSIGGTMFLVIIPWVLAIVGRTINSHIGFDLPYAFKVIAAVVFIFSGLFFLAWSALSQWIIGKGTPSPFVPTEELVVAGPYKLCRNPIQLGGILYYLGFGVSFDSLTAGLFCFLVGLIIGSVYHKFVEEKELLIRFGEEYRKYKERTPFLIPRLSR